MKERPACTRTMTGAVLLALAGWAHAEGPSAAHGKLSDQHERAHPEQPGAKNRDEPTAADVADAPRPGKASGLEKIPRPPRYLAIPRTLLTVPRLGLELVNLPVRGVLYSLDRYGIVARLQRLLAGPSTVAVQPLVRLDSDFGLHFGGRTTVRNLFDKGESMRVQAGFGGQFEQYYGTRIDSGDALGRGSLRFEFEIEDQGNQRFAGIGNSDRSAPESGALIDPRMSNQAVQTRFSELVLRSQLDVGARFAHGLYGRLSGAHLWREFGDTGDPGARNLADVYDPRGLIGYETGLSTLYTEGLFGIDRRVRTADPEAVTIPHGGWSAEGFVGWAQGIGVDPSSYARVGFDVQGFFEPLRADRIIAVRAYAEGISDGVDQVPFVDLPALGGSRMLRGYRSRRFRGQYLALAEVEYHWSVGPANSAFFLLDAGRVFRDADDFSLAAVHLSYGGGLLLHTGTSYLARLYVAGSSETARVYLSFSPVFQVKDRTRRY